MSEHLRREQYARLAGDIHSAIDEDEGIINEISRLPSIQAYADIFKGAHLLRNAVFYPGPAAWATDLAYPKFATAEEQGRTVTDYINSLTISTQQVLADEWLRTKGRTAALTPETIEEIFDHVVRQGIPKTASWFERIPSMSPGEAKTVRGEVLSTLPHVLFIAATFRQLASVEEKQTSQIPEWIDTDELQTLTDTAMQDACRQIQRNKRIHAQSRSALDMQFANIMNVMRDAYTHAPMQLDRVIQTLYPLYTPRGLAKENTGRLGAGTVRGESLFMIERFYLGIEEMSAYAGVAPYTQDVTRLIHGFRKLNEGWRSTEEWEAASSEAYGQLRMIRSLRHLVDYVAEGRVKMTDIITAGSRQRAHTLGTRLRRREWRESHLRDLGWEPLRRGSQARVGEPATGAALEGEHPASLTEFDEERLAWLETLGEMWGDDWYIVRRPLDQRARIDKHSESEDGEAEDDEERRYPGYYVLILPERLINGRIIEHAIADSKVVGKKAVYVYRAELGQSTGITWSHVFDGNRRRAHALGAIRVKHIGDYRFRILDRLTEPMATYRRRVAASGLGQLTMESSVITNLH